MMVSKGKRVRWVRLDRPAIRGHSVRKALRARLVTGVNQVLWVRSVRKELAESKVHLARPVKRATAVKPG